MVVLEVVDTLTTSDFGLITICIHILINVLERERRRSGRAVSRQTASDKGCLSISALRRSMVVPLPPVTETEWSRGETIYLTRWSHSYRDGRFSQELCSRYYYK